MKHLLIIDGHKCLRLTLSFIRYKKGIYSTLRVSQLLFVDLCLPLEGNNFSFPTSLNCFERFKWFLH